MPIVCTGAERSLHAAIDGEVDHHRTRALLAELDRQIDQRLPGSLTLDLSGVTFMDSSGIALLLRARDRMSRLGGSLRVVHVPEQAGRVLRAAGLDRLLHLE